jgi:hypothetical protein
MLLDAVLADRHYTWLGTEQDKRTYFREALERDLRDDWYPHLTFGTGAEKTTRFFPDKLPIGVPLKGARRHVFLYLATREVPIDFRAFLLQHADLLKAVDEWTIRVLLPRRFRKAAALYRYARSRCVPDAVGPARDRRARLVLSRSSGGGGLPGARPGSRPRDGRSKVRRRPVRGAVSLWQQRGVHALWTMQDATSETSSNAGRDASNSPNSGTSICSSRHSSASPRGENGLREGDNLTTA